MDPVAKETEATATSSPILENLLILPRMLRHAGLPISLDQTLAFAHGLQWVDVTRREQVFHTARALLVTRQETLRLFEAIFHSFWRLCREGNPPAPRRAPTAPRHDLTERKPFTIVDYLAFKAKRSDPEIGVSDRAATFSHQEVLQHKNFAEMTPEEIVEVRRLIQDMRWQASLRRTRRRIADRRGEMIDLRQVLRRLAQTGCVPPRPARRSRKIKPRPIVLIADISGSMEKISRLILQLFFSVSSSLTDVECFTFGTRLSRITEQLKIRNIDRAIHEASREVADWSGGTRIGESLNVFNRQWNRRVLRRGAVVLIVSDGWERGEASLLATEMRRLAARCHRLIWLNPLLGESTYHPVVEGMAVALPYVDDFLPVHNLVSLRQLVEHLRSLPSRRS